jgi:hypothetical protein
MLSNRYIYEKCKHTELYLITILILQKHIMYSSNYRIIQYRCCVNIVQFETLITYSVAAYFLTMSR